MASCPQSNKFVREHFNPCAQEPGGAGRNQLPGADWQPSAGFIGHHREGSFTGANGSCPYGLTDAGGCIYYGLNYRSGLYDAGGTYEFNSATGAITPKDSCNLANGGAYGTLTAAGGGIDYGTTIFWGTSDLGTVYEFNSATGAITLKASFMDASTPYPWALTAAGGDIYYGTTSEGGANGLGFIDAFNSASGAISVVESFDGANGSNPSAALTAASNGIFYGTTHSGGAAGLGTVFEFNANSPTNTVPGPLPLVGAAAAFHCSRRLRRRVRSAGGSHRLRPMAPTPAASPSAANPPA
jgi:uncharacterized repeat protein (TIGR03803 family)